MNSANVIDAFEFATTLEHIRLPKAKATDTLSIKCIEYSNYRLYVGTSTGHILMYELDRENIIYATLLNYIQHGQKRSIEHMILAESITSLVVLCHGRIVLFSINDHLEYQKNQFLNNIRSVTTCCKNYYPINDNPFTTEIVVGTKNKNIYMVELCDKSYNVVYECVLAEVPVKVTAIEHTVLVATEFSYIIIDMKNNRKESLFNYNINEFSPSVQSYSKDIFFITGPTAEMAMHINVKGIAVREPIISKYPILNIIEYFPYSIILSMDSIIIQQMTTNEIVQKFILQPNSTIKFIEGHIFIYCNSNVRYIRPISIEKQLVSLLDDNDLARAFKLMEIVEKNPVSNSSLNLEEIKLSVVYIKLSSLLLNDAKEIFIENQLDIVPLLQLYEATTQNFKLNDQPWSRSVSGKYYNHLVEMMINDENLGQFFNDFMIDLLESVRSLPKYSSTLNSIDTLLARLYAQVDHTNFLAFLHESNRCKYNETVEFLQLKSKYYGLSLLYIQRGKEQLACDLWEQLLTERIEDKAFSHMSYMIECIKYLSQVELFWNILNLLSKKHANIIIEIFQSITWNSFENESNQTTDITMIDIPVGDIVEFLSKYPYHIQLPFYEHLVYNLNMTNQSYHTKLAQFYIVDLKINLQHTTTTTTTTSGGESLSNEFNFNINTREKLKKLLESSHYYNASDILAQLGDMPLHQERIILLSALGHHTEALQILINVLEDFDNADNYCKSAPERSPTPITSKQLYQALFSIIVSNSNNQQSIKKSTIIDFINQHINSLQPSTTTKLLPDNYKLSDMNSYLNKACNKNNFEYFQSAIHSGVSHLTLNNVANELKYSSNNKISLWNENTCYYCHGNLDTPNVALSNNGFILHQKCYDDQNLKDVTN